MNSIISFDLKNYKQSHELFYIGNNYLYNFLIYKNIKLEDNFYIFIENTINLNMFDNSNKLDLFLNKCINDNKFMLINFNMPFVKMLLTKKIEEVKLIFIKDKIILERYINKIFSIDEFTESLSNGMYKEINQKVYRKLIRLIYQKEN